MQGQIRSLEGPRETHFLPILVLLSGFCGISYEILYARLLGNLIGNQFIINASVLLAFLFGIGLGSLFAHRLAGYLWLIEGGIGLYALLLLYFYGAIDHWLYSALPAAGAHMYTAALMSIALLITPALLLGCSIPLFAGYMSTLRTRGVFSYTYAIYNFGAALTALAMEFILLRALGLRSSILFLAALNGITAVAILVLMKSRQLSSPHTPERLRYPARVLLALAIAGVASAVFQLLMIKLSEVSLGPSNETFALVLATVLLGLALGALTAEKFCLSFAAALTLVVAGIAWLLIVFKASLIVYALFYQAAAARYLVLVLLKFSLVLALALPCAVGFGAVLPALLLEYKNVSRESGQLLFVSSMANAAGFLLMAFVLHQHLSYRQILISVAVLTLLALHLHPHRKRIFGGLSAGFVALAVFGYTTHWDEDLLWIGYNNFRSAGVLKHQLEQRIVAEEFKGPQNVFAILTKDDSPYFFINGYNSIVLTSPSEKTPGALSTMLSPRTDRALVLGLGSGSTAGTVGLFFDHTDVVEINELVVENVHRMAEYNFNIHDMKRVTLIHDDGIRFIKTTPKKYSLILNTVTSPLYFSSSKLYTRDFLELVVQRMEPDGVYATWVDHEIGEDGINIALETLDSVFEKAWLFYLRPSYFLLICSNRPLQPHQFERIVTNGQLAEYYAVETQTPVRLLPHSILSLNALDLPRGEGPINTLDLPALEFAIARAPKRSLDEFKKQLGARFDPEALEESLGDKVDWSIGDFLLYIDLQRRMASMLTRATGPLIPKLLKEHQAEYKEAALAAASEVGSSKAYFKIGRMLMKRQIYDAAVTLVNRALEIDPEYVDAHFVLAQCASFQNHHELALQHSLTAWERAKESKAPLPGSHLAGPTEALPGSTAMASKGKRRR